MLARFISLVSAILIFLFPSSKVLAAMASANDASSPSSIELPSALADDDSFDDLPFEQLRQALREEVERDPQKNPRPHSYQRYNWLIR